MTVVQLIQLLMLAPPGAQVETEGCGCVGDAMGLRVSEDAKTVTIIRVDGVETRNLRIDGSLPVLLDARGAKR